MPNVSLLNKFLPYSFSYFCFWILTSCHQWFWTQWERQNTFFCVLLIIHLKYVKLVLYFRILIIMLEFPHRMLELALYFKMLLTLCCLLIGETLHRLKCVFALLHLFHLKIIKFQLALPPSSVYCHFPPRWVQPLQIFPTSHVNYAITWKIKVMYGIQRSGSQHSSTLGLRKQNRRVNLKLAHSACFLKTTRTPSPSTCLLGSWNPWCFR